MKMFLGHCLSFNVKTFIVSSERLKKAPDKLMFNF
jgi:hypothetical protein